MCELWLQISSWFIKCYPEDSAISKIALVVWPCVIQQDCTLKGEAHWWAHLFVTLLSPPICLHFALQSTWLTCCTPSHSPLWALLYWLQSRLQGENARSTWDIYTACLNDYRVALLCVFSYLHRVENEFRGDFATCVTSVKILNDQMTTFALW